MFRRIRNQTAAVAQKGVKCPLIVRLNTAKFKFRFESWEMLNCVFFVHFIPCNKCQ